MKNKCLWKKVPLAMAMVLGVSSVPQMNLMADTQTEEEEWHFSDYNGYMQLDDWAPQSVKDTNSIVPRVATSPLPASYVNENVPGAKDQGQYGTCWSFAALGCAEANLMQKGYSDVDLSELHLAYFAYHTATDPLGGITDTKTTGADWINLGGQAFWSANALADWVGAADESVAKYEDAGTIRDTGLSDELAFNDAYHLENYFYLNNTDEEEIKRAIMEYGAVQLDLYTPTSAEDVKNYYSYESNGYYCSDEKNTNHCVMIIGWDDNFEASNFANTPEGNGAWIIRNSWGETRESSPIAHLFHLSYYDKSIGDYVTVFDLESADNFDHNYQYDGALHHDYYVSKEVTSIKAANVFTAKANPDGSEEIAAASFETGSVNSSYQVDVYKNLSDIDNPESGTLCATQTGIAPYAGMYTVRFDNAVEIQEGENYSVVVTLKVATGNKSSIVADRDTPSSWPYQSDSNAKENQSYIFDNGAWYDFGEVYDTNVRIKAYTNDVNELEEEPEVPEEPETPEEEPEQEKTTGIFENESGELCYYVNGNIQTGYYGLVEYNDNQYYVSNGYVQTNKNGAVMINGTIYYLKNGIVDSNYSGIGYYNYTWYYFANGKVDYGYTGFAENEDGKWYVVSGRVNTNYRGIVSDGTNTWYVAGGKVDTSYNGILVNSGRWCVVENGKVLTNYTGIASGFNGKWYFKNGNVNYGFRGTVVFNGIHYFVQNGRVIYEYK